jgi:hypothetical protein
MIPSMKWILLLALGCGGDPDKAPRDTTGDTSTPPVSTPSTATGVTNSGTATGATQTGTTRPTEPPTQFVVEPAVTHAERIGLARTLTTTLDAPGALVVTLDDGREPRTLRFDAVGTDHAVPILGLQADTAYTLTIATDPPGPEATVALTTDPLPPDFPLLEVLANDPTRTEPGVTLITPKSSASPGFLIILDEALTPIWYHRAEPDGFTDVRRGPDGAFWGTSGGSVVRIALDQGETDVWHTISGRPDAIEMATGNLHHSVIPQADGSFWTLTWDSIEADDHPTTYRPDGPLERQRISDGAIIHVLPDGTVSRMIALRDVLERTRLAWDCLDPNNDLGVDWVHPNGLELDLEARTLVVTLRHQDAVIALDLDTTEVLWIVSNPAGWSPTLAPRVLTGAPGTTWPFHPHAARLTATGELLMFDNRNVLNTPYDDVERDRGTASRVVSYRLNPEAGTADEAWSYDSPPGGDLFVVSMGDADLLPSSGNVLSTWANLDTDGGVENREAGRGDKSARIIEFHPDAPDPPALDLRVYSDRDVESRGWHVFRSERLPALYPDGLLR